MQQRKQRSKKEILIWIAFIFGFSLGRASTFLSLVPLEETQHDLSLLGFHHQRSDDDRTMTDDAVAIDVPIEATPEIRQKVGQWPNPLLVVGLPKAGTSSIAEYFRCGGIEKVAHHKCLNRACGAIIQKNLQAGRSPLFATGKNDVYVQIDVELNVDKGLPCFFPQIEALEDLHHAHPNSTLLLNTRDINAWVRSVRAWAGMDTRLSKCNITGLPAGKGLKERELKRFFSNQALRVAKFVDRFPSHQLVNVKIDSPDAGEVMETAFGISRTCWGHHNNNLK